MRRPIIAIDGPAGSGKSTLARSLARALDIPYVNTGLMYRALAARALATGIDPDDGDALLALLAPMRFDLGGGPPAALRVDGREPGAELSTPEVEEAVSHVARHPGVRSAMRDLQRALGADGGAVEGRDIGTVVFPDADAKLFLDAEEADRAARRRRERGDAPSVEEALATRNLRDARVNPFVPAADAVTIDTGALDAERTLARALEVVRARIGGAR